MRTANMYITLSMMALLTAAMPYKNKADNAAAVKRWREKHPERKKAADAKEYRDNPKKKERNAKYQREHSEQARAYVRRSRAKKKFESKGES